jgi:hypothetical protein
MLRTGGTLETPLAPWIDLNLLIPFPEVKLRLSIIATLHARWGWLWSKHHKQPLPQLVHLLLHL